MTLGNDCFLRGFCKCPFGWTEYIMHVVCAHKKDLSPGFLLIHDLHRVVVDLPQLLQIHALQLLDDADGEGVPQIVGPLSR